MKWFRKEDERSQNPDSLVYKSAGLTERQAKETIDYFHLKMLTPNPLEIFDRQYVDMLRAFNVLVIIAGKLEDKEMAERILQMNESLPQYLLQKRFEVHLIRLKELALATRQNRFGWRERRKFQIITEEIDQTLVNITAEQILKLRHIIRYEEVQAQRFLINLYIAQHKK